MTKSLSRPYVRWLHETVGHWATWLPGQDVQPGAVGRFGDDLKFYSYMSLADLGMSCEVSEERPIGDQLYKSASGFELKPKVGAKGVVHVWPPANVRVKATLTAKRGNVSVLHMKSPTSKRLLTLESVLKFVKQAVVESRWPLDQIVVVERIKVDAGFAIVSAKKGMAVDVDVGAGLGLTDSLEAYSGDVSLAMGHEAAAAFTTDFVQGQTPVFSEAVRVRQVWWRQILNLPPQVLDPSGAIFDPDQASDEVTKRTNRNLDAAAPTPANLAHLLVEQRFYNPKGGAVSAEALMAMPVSSLFETLDQPMRFLRPTSSSQDAPIRSMIMQLMNAGVPAEQAARFIARQKALRGGEGDSTMRSAEWYEVLAAEADVEMRPLMLAAFEDRRWIEQHSAKVAAASVRSRTVE